jgi:hypothetical protein
MVVAVLKELSENRVGLANKGDRMSFLRAPIVVAGMAWSAIALGVTVSEPASQEPESAASLHYKKAIAKVEKYVTRGPGITQGLFRSFNWVGRTAAINYACSATTHEICRRVLMMGAEDRALLVRDHALKVILHSDQYVQEEKVKYARMAVEDIRNYRTGQPLWIVTRARKYLEDQKG